MRHDDLTPLPRWQQKRRALVAWWHRTRDRRRAAYRTFKSGAASALTLAISVVGAILISAGVYQMYAPAGYVVGGFMCWLLLWSHEQDGRRRE